MPKISLALTLFSLSYVSSYFGKKLAQSSFLSMADSAFTSTKTAYMAMFEFFKFSGVSSCDIFHCKLIICRNSKLFNGIEPKGFCILVRKELRWWKERRSGAGEGNRTLVVSLGSFCSTIELHPQEKEFYIKLELFFHIFLFVRNPANRPVPQSFEDFERK